MKYLIVTSRPTLKTTSVSTLVPFNFIALNNLNENELFSF
jgi:hypothetical protein